jgi:hypothetical protein
VTNLMAEVDNNNIMHKAQRVSDVNLKGTEDGGLSKNLLHTVLLVQYLKPRISHSIFEG